MSALLKTVVPNDPIAAHVGAILGELGEDVRRGGLADTPARYAKALRYLTGGYEIDVGAAIGNGIFPAEGASPVVLRDIDFHSLCEHHVLPFFGHVHVGYVPDRRIIGLSKIPRIVDVFSRRLQVQERFTEQVADALVAALEPKGVVVVTTAQHLCMAMRGVQKQGSTTTIRAVRGAADELVAALRAD
jgi:GTP cyclohydrolase I